MNLENKVAVVTGSGGEGSGRAEARRLAAEGCHVVVSDTNVTGGKETVGLIESVGGRAKFCQCDVNAKDDVKVLLAFAEKEVGGVDILVNNASGVHYQPNAPIEQWYETIHGDLVSAIYGLEFGIAALRKRGGGAIVNVSSTSALGHGKDHSPAPAYDTAKAGVLRLTTTLAGLSKTENIRVNCLVPAWIATPEVKTYWDALT
jgi:NAD(P)-dependent dehydrogenase (short-subunit alcohol dehydrogenase family)